MREVVVAVLMATACWAQPAENRDVAELAAGQARFALDFYGRQAKTDNLFYSPYSIASAFAMTHGGARGETAAQMARVLGFTLPPARLGPACAALAKELAAREAARRGQEGFKLRVANALWGQEGYAFLAPFLAGCQEHYGAGLRHVNFAADTEQARRTINGWVSKETNDRIKDLVPAGVLTALTRLVLTNAVYFLAPWDKPFEKHATQDAPFTTLAGAKASVPMMHQTETHGYARGEGWQAVELRYAGRQLAMTVLVPDAGQFAAVSNGLDAARFAAVTGALKPARMNLGLPRFTVESSLNLGDALRALGMKDAFDQTKADFSGMDGTRNLYIQAALHKAFVKVDEAGTEAAAATAIAVGVRSMPAPPSVKLIIDRPFVLAVRDLPTGAILFLGRVTAPKA